MTKIQVGDDFCGDGATSDNATQEKEDNNNEKTSSNEPIMAEATSHQETSSMRPAATETIGPDDRADKGKEAFVTMVISNDFAIGAEVMFQSLRDHSRIRRPHVVLVTSAVSAGEREMLKAATDEMVEVEPIAMPPPEGTDFTVPGSGEYLGYTTLRVWGLTQYERVVYIDADTLIMECIDELFDRKVSFAAAPDVFPPDRFNPGVMVLTPSSSVLDDMLSKISDLPSYDGRDTGFLNAYFSDWFASSDAACRLPFAYNALRTVYDVTHENTPGYWKAIGPAKIIHFNGHLKPWEDGAPKGGLEMVWWKRYLEMQTE